MSLRIGLSLFAIAAGCGPKHKPLSDHPQPLSLAEHRDEAQRHDVEARHAAGTYDPERSSSKAPEIRCYDDPVDDVSTSGGEPLTIIKPCWASVTSPSSHHQQVAERHRREADAHRRRAAELVGAEKRACAGLGVDAISHSPFFHKEDLVRVEPIRDPAGKLKGARAVFARVPGLTVEWLERAAACHQARAAVMGFSSSFMSYCPLAVAPSALDAGETSDGFWIRIESADSGPLIWKRARALVED